jgi:ABC-2 type transport system ATP-binding protein
LKAIEVCGISKSYKDVKAVDDISFTVERESICAILGPNGSGKTTTIKSICNLIQLDQGEIRILGKKNRKATNHISAVFEGTRNLYWRLTPKENLRYFAGISGLGGKNACIRCNCYYFIRYIQYVRYFINVCWIGTYT